MNVGQLMKVARIAPFAIVIVAPVLASGVGLVAVGHGWLGLHSWAGLLVPLTLDAAALSFAFLSWQATADDEAAGVERLLVWVFAAASAGLNIWYADSVGGAHSATFFGIASLTAALVWERMLHALQRRKLRELGRVDGRAPRFRFLRWVLFPIETAGSFRLAVGEGISDPRTAIDRYRRRNDPATDVAEVEQTTARISAGEPSRKPAQVEAAKPAPAKKPAARPVAPRTTSAVQVPAPELQGCKTKKAMIIRAFDAVGSLDGQAAIEWLAARGVTVDKSGTYRIARELRAADETETAGDAVTGPATTSPHLVAVGGEDR